MQKVRVYIVLLCVVAIFSALAIVFTLVALTPSLLLNLYLFYLFLSLFCFSALALAGLYMRKAFGRRELMNYYFAVSLRQALWFTIILAVSLFLSSHKLFTWLNAAFLILALVFLESYLITKNDRKP